MDARDLHQIDGPQNQSKDGQQAKELFDLATSGLGHSRPMDRDMPDDEQVGNAADRIPAPFLGRVRVPKGSKESRKRHDEVGHDGHEGVRAIDSSEKAELKHQQRCRETPVDVASPKYLSTVVMVRVGDVLVMLPDYDAVVACCMTRGHGEVGDGSDDGGQGGDNVEGAACDGDIP